MTIALIMLTAVLPVSAAEAVKPDAKPKVAVFPLGGDAKPEARDKVGYSLRVKIDREGTYEVIDGPTMKDLVGEMAFSYDTKLPEVEKFAKDENADVMIWGELNNASDGMTLRVRIFDRRQLDPLPHQMEKRIREPTDLRFVSEQIIEGLADVKAFEHPSEVAVQRDAIAEKLWVSNPNLVINGTFDVADHWAGIYRSEYYTVKFSDSKPEPDKVVIYRMPVDGQKPNPVLAMNLTRECAETNGLACLSDSFPIEPKTRYRLKFRYMSDGPTVHLFIKGYTMEKNITGETVQRECYRRQVPPSGKTKGKWVEIIDEMNPQHVAYPVQFLKVDLYTYLYPGTVMFDDVVIKAVGAPTRIAKDKALKAPATRPTTRAK